MYNMPYYKESDDEVIQRFVADNPFAFLSGCDGQHRPVATQVPTFLETKNGKKVLRGHIMKNTDHHKAWLQNPNVLAVFTGPHAYVSGSWYSNPNTASTWNYKSVQVSGKLRFVNEDELAELMRKTTLHFENGNANSPTVYDNLPTNFIEWASKMIAGFEIEVHHIEAIFKLSQDRDESSYQNIIEKLKQQGGDSQVIAKEMQKRQARLFSKNN